MFVVRSSKPTVGLPSRKTMLETLIRRLDLVRLTVAAAAILMAAGCTGLIDDTVLPTDLEKDEANARRLWDEKAWPILEVQCGGCHTTMPMIDFFNTNGADPVANPYAVREALVAFTPAVVNLETPPSSRLLTKGFHSGPELCDAVGGRRQRARSVHGVFGGLELGLRSYFWGRRIDPEWLARG